MSIKKQSIEEYRDFIKRLEDKTRKNNLTASLTLIQETEPIFIRLLNAPDFPEYALRVLDSEDENDYRGVADFDYDKKELFLGIRTGRSISLLTLFHEFTHLLDMSIYNVGNRNTDKSLVIYTEYHALQSEMLLLLRAESIDAIPDFHIADPIFTNGKSLKDYWLDKLEQALNKLKNLECEYKLWDVLTLLGNYWGIRSIVEMKCIEYKEHSLGLLEHYQLRQEIMRNSDFQALNISDLKALDILMHGWLSKESVQKSMSICQSLIMNTDEPN